MLTVDPTGALIVIGILCCILAFGVYITFAEGNEPKKTKKIPSSYASYPVKFNFKYK
jgi:hypothetical protein